MDRDRSRARPGSSKGPRRDSEALWDWNLESDRIHFSPRWVALIGCDDHEVGSAPPEWLLRVHPDDREHLTGEIDAARAGDATTFACRYRVRHQDGSYRWLMCRGTVVRDNAGRAIRVTGADSDITVTVVTDRLTRLPNRLLLMDRLTHSIDRARRYEAFHFALLIADPGTPTSVGRSAAVTDTLITAVARRLESCLRIPDTMPLLRNNDLVARLDGHYFAILLDGLKDVGHARIAADRILQELLHPFTIGGREVRLSASIGIALSATGYTSAQEVVNDAETALHRARVLGGSHCEVFDTAIMRSEQTELQLEGDFEGALERREFELFYQPIVSLASNEVLGFESLVRWRHPVLGMIPPLDFIRIAERTGFVVPLGAWILHDACRQLAEWHRTLPLTTDLSVSVNVSGVQWSDPALVDHIQQALHESGLEPGRLVLEVTEGIAIANPTAVTTMLMRLRAVGVRISVDDFGTGYSSLAYLRQFPIDTLKIDRSFVRGMVSNKDTAEIVAGIMNLSNQLGLRVVAEGVEHEDQCAHLRALNCHAGQGNLFATPLDVTGATELLRTGLMPRPERPREVMTVTVNEPPHVGHRVAGGRRLMSGYAASIAAAAAVVVLVAVAGVLGVVNSGQPASSGQLAERVASQPSSERTPAAPVGAVASSVPPVPVKGPAAAAAPTAPRAVPPAQPTSMNVVHLHRFGNCRGRLNVSRAGVAFVSEGGDEPDSFALKHGDFLQSFSDDTLTLRTATRTFRFRAGEAGIDSTKKLRDLADRISRARP
jgi:diguanylate cyclase (GGDEF)-like protein